METSNHALRDAPAFAGNLTQALTVPNRNRRKVKKFHKPNPEMVNTEEHPNMGLM